MKTIHYLAVIAFLTTSAGAASPKVVVHAQLVELSGDTKLPKDASTIAARKGIDVFTSPRLETRSGKPTKLSVTRQFTFPNKGTFPIGISLGIRPTLDGERVRYSVDFDQTEFEGFAPSSNHAPMFTMRKVIGIDGATAIGKSVVLDLSSREDKQTVQDRGKPARTETIRRHLYAILRFTTS